MVISRDTSDCQSLAAARTSMTAPTVSEARNVMIGTTATSARPAIDAFGTIGVSARVSRPAIRCVTETSLSIRRSLIAGSIVGVQPAVVQHQAAGVVLVHQGDVVGRDHHGGAGLVELDEQPQQALRQAGV